MSKDFLAYNMLLVLLFLRYTVLKRHGVLLTFIIGLYGNGPWLVQACDKGPWPRMHRTHLMFGTYDLHQVWMLRKSCSPVGCMAMMYLAGAGL